jgi:hypothetical protein
MSPWSGEVKIYTHLYTSDGEFFRIGYEESFRSHFKVLFWGYLGAIEICYKRLSVYPVLQFAEKPASTHLPQYKSRLAATSAW